MLKPFRRAAHAGELAVVDSSHPRGPAIRRTSRRTKDPAKHPDLHGNVPDDCPVVLLVVDVLNALRFEGSEAFVPRAVAVGERIAALKNRARALQIPTVYVNDNGLPSLDS